MSDTKIEAAAAVLAAMGGTPTVDGGSVPNETAPVVAPKAKKKAAKKVVAKPKAKAKKPEAPKKPGPKRIDVEFPANTTHKLAGGGTIEIAKVRHSYLVRLNGGRLKWFSALKVKAMVESKAAAAAEHEELEASVPAEAAE
jgi:hypothetical protein